MDHPYLMHADGKEWHTIMTNTDIKSLEAVKNQSGIYEIQFTLTDQGREIFSQHTTENVGNHLGIVLDKVVISNPRIDGPITEGLGVIAGTFTKEKAEELAMLLRMKPLPIPIRVAQ